jgi:hypothetical protein
MSSDFCKIFNDDLDHLYTLSLLLTADPQKAEQCFVTGLEDCLEENRISRKWARSCARRSVIKNAIRAVSPVPTETISRSENTEAIATMSGLASPAAAVMKLLPFERFVYVLSLLERCSDGECATLLACTVQEIVHTRTGTIYHVVSMLTGQRADELAPAV